MTRRYFIWIILIGLTALAFIQQPFLLSKPVPKKLPKIDSSLTELTWPRIVNSHYLYFAVEDNYYSLGEDTSESAREITVSTFGSVWGWTYKENPNEPNTTHSLPIKGSIYQPAVYNSIIRTFYKSNSSQIALYKWVKPLYINAYKKFPEWRKNVFRRMLVHAKKYISEFNYEAELGWYKKDPFRFSIIGLNGGDRGEFRRLELFVFRRVHNGDLTLKQMLSWVNILQKDINSIN